MLRHLIRSRLISPRMLSMERGINCNHSLLCFQPQCRQSEQCNVECRQRRECQQYAQSTTTYRNPILFTFISIYFHIYFQFYYFQIHLNRFYRLSINIFYENSFELIFLAIVPINFQFCWFLSIFYQLF